MTNREPRGALGGWWSVFVDLLRTLKGLPAMFRSQGGPPR